MYLVSYRATERSARRALRERRAELDRERLLLARRAYEAQLEEAEHLAQIKRVAEERAEAMATEMKALGYPFRHTYRGIEERACRLFKVKPSEIRSNRRNRGIVMARQFVMYWATRLTKLSLPQIGRLMGGRDHTTVLHGKNIYPVKRAEMGRRLREAR